MIETAVVCLNIKVVNSNSLILSYRLCINDVDKFIFAYSYHILNLTVTSQSSKNLTLFPASHAGGSLVCCSPGGYSLIEDL